MAILKSQVQQIWIHVKSLLCLVNYHHLHSILYHLTWNKSIAFFCSSYLVLLKVAKAYFFWRRNFDLISIRTLFQPLILDVLVRGEPKISFWAWIFAYHAFLEAWSWHFCIVLQLSFCNFVCFLFCLQIWKSRFDWSNILWPWNNFKLYVSIIHKVYLWKHIYDKSILQD